MSWPQWLVLIGGFGCLICVGVLIYFCLWLITRLGDLQYQLDARERVDRARAREMDREARTPLR